MPGTARLEDSIRPLNLGGMRGRLLHVKATRKSSNLDFLVIYDRHSSLENITGLVEVLKTYGSVTVPDLPGMGGMDSFYSVHQKPSLDSLADYLATFIRWRFKRKRMIIVGQGFGFIVITRMFQLYPALQGKVEFVISLGGFSHHEDFRPDPPNLMLKCALMMLSWKLPAWAAQRIFMRPLFIRTILPSIKLGPNPPSKDKLMLKEKITKEAALWRLSDLRTHAYTGRQILTLDNCTQKISLPLYHVFSIADKRFDHFRVEQHLQVVFSDYQVYKVKSKVSANDELDDKKKATTMIPPALKRRLRERA